MADVSFSRPTVVLVVVTTAIALVVGGLAGWGASTLSPAHATSSGQEQLGCVDVANKTITLISPSQSCKASLLPVVWQTGTAKKGAPGATGPKGDTGAIGATGATGATGKAGSAVAKGDTGAAGATGATGSSGATGATGAPGAAGVVAWSAVSAWDQATAYAPGPPASIVTYQGGAYVAVAANIDAPPSVGSASWAQIAAPGQIGIQGPQGDPGPAGLVGPVGPVGPAGADGTNGTDGADGAAGATGPAGPQGPAGTPGNNDFAGEFGSDAHAADGASGEECTVGEVTLTAGRVANGMIADGRTLQISDYTELYILLGARFGGNGTTNFALPNLTSLAPNGLTYSICVNGLYPQQS
jgi:Phage Tail Collar Domain/Collagen triple helix repeat (20 copies)